LAMQQLLHRQCNSFIGNETAPPSAMQQLHPGCNNSLGNATAPPSAILQRQCDSSSKGNATAPSAMQQLHRQAHWQWNSSSIGNATAPPFQWNSSNGNATAPPPHWLRNSSRDNAIAPATAMQLLPWQTNSTIINKRTMRERLSVLLTRSKFGWRVHHRSSVKPVFLSIQWMTTCQTDTKNNPTEQSSMINTQSSNWREPELTKVTRIIT
jgi:hypothetical protein